MSRRTDLISTRRRGMIFITALGIIVILSGLLLAFAQNMRSEAIASANRVASLQADAIEQAGEQWVMAQVDLNATLGNNGTPDSWTLVFGTPAEQIQVGSGYFWLIRANDNTDQDYDYGIVDESGKLNLNASTLTSDILLTLPTDMTQDVADAVLDWKNPVTAASADGAESDYYNSLPEPYDCKNEPFETVEEMLLVRGITEQTLFGYDLNHDGVFDANERDAGGSAASANSGTSDTRGIFRFLTVYSSGGTALTPAATGGGGGRGGGGGGGGAAAGATTTPAGYVNVNTASEAVLMALGLTQSQADTLISQRSGTPFTDAASVRQALAGAAPPATFYSQTTATSYQYSADIVAVSGDGRAYKRVRIVVDCAPATTTGTTGAAAGGAAAGATAATATTPCKIVYRRDLTGLGWPLGPEVRTALRSGQGLAAGGGGSNIMTVGNH